MTAKILKLPRKQDFVDTLNSPEWKQHCADVQKYGVAYSCEDLMNYKPTQKELLQQQQAQFNQIDAWPGYGYKEQIFKSPAEIIKGEEKKIRIKCIDHALRGILVGMTIMLWVIILFR